jgi:hypothetical protein
MFMLSKMATEFLVLLALLALQAVVFAGFCWIRDRIRTESGTKPISTDPPSAP